MRSYSVTEHVEHLYIGRHRNLKVCLACKLLSISITVNIYGFKASLTGKNEFDTVDIHSSRHRELVSYWYAKSAHDKQLIYTSIARKVWILIVNHGQIKHDFLRLMTSN